MLELLWQLRDRDLPMLRVIRAKPLDQTPISPGPNGAPCCPPTELLDLIIDKLDEMFKISHDFTESYLHTSVQTQCFRAPVRDQRVVRVQRLERDI